MDINQREFTEAEDILGEHLTVEELRAHCTLLINEIGGLGIRDVLELAGYTRKSISAYTRTQRHNPTSPYVGLYKLQKFLDEAGLETIVTVKVKKKKRSNKRRPVNERVVQNVLSKRKRISNETKKTTSED